MKGQAKPFKSSHFLVLMSEKQGKRSKAEMHWNIITKDPYLFDIVYDVWNAGNLKSKFFHRLEPFAKF